MSVPKIEILKAIRIARNALELDAQPWTTELSDPSRLRTQGAIEEAIGALEQVEAEL